MGRLFWKIFLAFWLTLLATAAAVGVLVHLYQQQRIDELSEVAAGPRAELALEMVEATLRSGGVEAARATLRRWRGPPRFPVLMVDPQGRELLGRPVPAEALRIARERLADGERLGVRNVDLGDGQTVLLFVAVPEGAPHGRSSPRLPSPIPALLVLALASLLFSAWLAWYLARPVRHLRGATRRIAEGELGTRIGGAMGRRRDEIADLGGDFDRMAERLQGLVAAQRRLLHDVSHELRSPLARLQLAVGLIRQQPQRSDEFLQRIERESGRLDELVGDLLTLSRIEAGGHADSLVPIDLVPLLAELADDARFEGDGAGCEVRHAGQGQVLVQGDARLLRRAFENLIRNALEHTPAGGVVEVSLAAAGGQVEVRVEDRGPGVPEGELERLFEPFVRVDPATVNPRREGYGLGLAIARRAVESHHGRIRARNREGGGLTMVVELPVAESG